VAPLGVEGLTLFIIAVVRLALLERAPSSLYWGVTDSLRLILIYLSVWLTPLIVTASWGRKNIKGYRRVIKILLLSLMFSFTAPGSLQFYIYFEWSLIPIFIIIMGWGYQPERMKARLFILFYTLAASLPLLMTLLFLSSQRGGLFFYQLTSLGCGLPYLLRVFLILGFLVKLPVFGAHLWLPKAHVEAPVAGRIILAGVLLKLGGYGLVRFGPLLRHGGRLALISLTMAGGGFLGLLCCRCADIKVIIAYSSVVHMAMVILSLYSFSKVGVEGGVLTIVAHGLTSSAMFIGANLIYERSHSRRILMNKGLLRFSPFFFNLLVFNYSNKFCRPVYFKSLRGNPDNLFRDQNKNLDSCFCIFFIFFLRGLQAVVVR